MSPFFHPLKIGGVSLGGNLILSPLAGFTDAAYRRLAAERGAALTVTEMVSVNGLKYNSVNTAALLERADRETPCAVQLFGSDPQTFYNVISARTELDGFEIIDINMGCPMPKVTKLGAGSALLSEPVKAAEIVRACAEAARRPVTVKMRLGVGDALGAESFAERMQEAGAAAVTVHGRTAKQLYGGKADWERIADIKKAVSIPVIGNGDLLSAADFERRMKESGADGIAVGRGALGGGELFAEISGRKPQSKAELALMHIEYMRRCYNDSYALLHFRAHAPYYFKGVTGGKEVRRRINETKDLETVCALVREGLK